MMAVHDPTLESNMLEVKLVTQEAHERIATADQKKKTHKKLKNS